MTDPEDRLSAGMHAVSRVMRRHRRHTVLVTGAAALAALAVAVPAAIVLASATGIGHDHQINGHWTNVGRGRAPGRDRSARGVAAGGILRHDPVIYSLRKVIWTIPGSASPAYGGELAALHERIQTEGSFVSTPSGF
jgi:hypothetical protein